MKKLLLAFMFILSGQMAFSQNVGTGDSQINAGVGFGGSWGIPVYVGFDYGVHKDWTVGAELSFASQKFNNTYKGTWFGLGANANYHFNSVLNIPAPWDLYAGATLAYNSFKYDTGYIGTASGVGFSGQVGARYFFSPKFGLNLEYGGGTVASGGKAGVTLRF